VVVTPGETVTFVPTKAPGFHVYDTAPAPVKVAELPEQITVGLLDAVTVGVGLTTNETVDEFVQAPFAPVTV